MSAITAWLGNLGAMLLVVEVLITSYLLFYLLRDSTAAKAVIVAWHPLSKLQAGQLLRRVPDLESIADIRRDGCAGWQHRRSQPAQSKAPGRCLPLSGLRPIRVLT